MTEKRKQEILLRLKELELEKVKLSQELESLKKSSIFEITSSARMTPDEKIKLFRSLFRGREDVYARMWKTLKPINPVISP